MKILLTAINAKYIHSNLAVYSLRAYAKEFRDDIKIAEYTINHRREDMLQGIYKEEPDILCFSCYIWNYEYVKELAEEFHKLKPQVPIWVGGPEVSYEIEEMFASNPAFFGVMIGEGEVTFAELCGHYCKGTALEEIQGIAFRKDEQIYLTSKREPMDMSEIPFCYDDITGFQNRIIYYESSRGCPFSCSYCLSSIDKKLRFRNRELVKKELAFFMEQEVPQVKFVDRTFNCNHEHAMDIWRFIQGADMGTTNFHFEIAADLLTEEETDLLATLRPGLVQLEIGVQSTNPETIQAINRSMSLPMVADKVSKIQKAANIHEHLDLIAGLPMEDYQTFQRSFCDIYRMKPNQLQLGFLKVLKGSNMYTKAKDYGILYQSHPPYEVLATKWLDFGEIIQIKLVEEMLEVYYNSGQFEVTMKLLDILYPDAFALFLRLGKYYDISGYRNMNHSRIRRCEILREFLKEEQAGYIELFEESLLFDLYYRENAKSRPFWAREPKGFSDVTRSYCKNGKLSHVEPFSYRFPDKGQKTINKLPGKEEKMVYMLFEYDKRDPLDHQAQLTEVKQMPKHQTEIGKR